MSIHIGDVSVESIISNLFSREDEDTYQLDPTLVEEIKTGDVIEPGVAATDTTPAVEPVVEQLPEEVEMIESPVEEDEGADPEALTEECSRLIGDVNTMTLAMRTAEQFVWSQANEVEEPNIFKKFWEWLKKIMGKLRMVLLTLFKYLQVFLAGDMKGISKWAASNKDAIVKGMASDGDKITLKIKPIISSFTALQSVMADQNEDLKMVGKYTDELASGKTSAASIKEVKDVIAKSDSVKKLSENFYGADATVKTVTMKQFDDKFKIIDGMGTASINSIKYQTSIIQAGLIMIQKSISAAQKLGKSSIASTEKESAKNLKALATAMHQVTSMAVTKCFWTSRLHVGLVKTAYAYAKKAADVKAKA